jgi:prophage maintenance system killer protein
LGLAHTADGDDAEAIVIAIAAGELDEAGAASWLREYLTPPP